MQNQDLDENPRFPESIVMAAKSLEQDRTLQQYSKR